MGKNQQQKSNHGEELAEIFEIQSVESKKKTEFEKKAEPHPDPES
jgi:hypothetical protein